jgi:hypothetical protein
MTPKITVLSYKEGKTYEAIQAGLNVPALSGSHDVRWFGI